VLYFKIKDALVKSIYYVTDYHICTLVKKKGKGKGKGVPNRPGVAQRVPGGLGSQIS
jgi:hypothetical protein